MQTVYTILMALVFVLAPAAIMRLCKRVQWLGKIGPVMILYILGVILGNIFHPAGIAKVQDLLSSAAIPVAIPMLLYGCTFRKGETRSQVLALVSAVISVVTVVIVGYFIFGRSIEGGDKIGAMLSGVYTGGTMNLAALQSMLGADEATFILLNSCDMIVSFLYLTFLMAIGIKLIRRWLPNETLVADSAAGVPDGGADLLAAAGEVRADDADLLAAAAGVSGDEQMARADGAAAVVRADEHIAEADGAAAAHPSARNIAWLVGATLLIVAIAGGLGALAPEGSFMTVFILALTTLGIAASFVPKLHNSKESEPIGMYAIYIFSITVASMADLRTLDILGSLNILGYLALVVFGSLALNLLLAKLLKIDADTTTVASVSFICSPPLVPMITAAMKNRRVLAAGLAIGIVGYAAGNYLGFLMYQLLKLM